VTPADDDDDGGGRSSQKQQQQQPQKRIWKKKWKMLPRAILPIPPLFGGQRSQKKERERFV